MTARVKLSAAASVRLFIRMKRAKLSRSSQRACRKKARRGWSCSRWKIIIRAIEHEISAHILFCDWPRTEFLFTSSHLHGRTEFRPEPDGWLETSSFQVSDPASLRFEDRRSLRFRCDEQHPSLLGFFHRQAARAATEQNDRAH